MSSYMSCIKNNLFSDSNLNCQCSNNSPSTSGGIGKSYTSVRGKYGEPWCWIKSSIKHACTDSKKDRSDDQIMPSSSGWYYSTVPCISKLFVNIFPGDLKFK